MAVDGEIARQARERIPTTWTALAAAEDRGAGESLLQGRVNSVKQRLFNEVVDPAQEVVEYHPLVIEYAGILVALAIIPSAVDYYQGQSIQHTARQGNENKQFLNRPTELWKLYKQLRADADSLLPQVEDILGPTSTARKRSVMRGSDAVDFDHFVTPDPFGFERPFERPTEEVT